MVGDPNSIHSTQTKMFQALYDFHFDESLPTEDNFLKLFERNEGMINTRDIQMLAALVNICTFIDMHVGHFIIY